MSTRVKVQAFGRFLSGMVMPNIGAFIAWGLITALFIPTGWLMLMAGQKVPEGAEKFIVYGFDIVKITNTMVGPMITYLLPLLIAYTGGKLVYGPRGGVVGAVATMGAIASAGIPMFLGAMIVGPLGGYCLKKIDEVIQPRVKSGFEMLVNNYVAGFLGLILAMLSFYAFGPLVEAFSNVLGGAVGFLVKNKLMFLSSIFVEPAKILFLNNAINHGVFSPIGVEQVAKAGKSMLFLIEANPGPGLGVLLAFTLFGKGQSKTTAPGAIIIHFIGGIHEIYFPYILMKPKMILAAIAGGMAGVATLNLTNAGLTAPASPGSIIAVLTMTAPGDHWKVILSVLLATVVSFLVGSIILKADKTAEDDGEGFEEASKKMKDLKNTPTGAATGVAGTASLAGLAGLAIKKIVVACDAGMGSSAMGASLLRKKVQDAGLGIEVINKAINEIPSDADLVITHKDLTERAIKAQPDKKHLSLENFMDGKFYDGVVENLKK